MKKSIEKYFSQNRIKRYLEATHQDINLASELYKANLRISKAFYPLLNTFEVCLRNQINTSLITYLKDENWIQNRIYDEKLSFMNKKGEENHFLLSELRKAREKVKKYDVSSGRIIAELNLGFWIAFFDEGYFKNFQGVFLEKGRGIFTSRHTYNRDKIYKKLLSIRELRNRIYHNEPIIFEKTTKRINLEHCKKVYENIIELFTLIDTTLLEWIRDLDDIINEINAAEKLLVYQKDK